MSKDNQEQFTQDSVKSEGDWDTAILEAERQILEAEKKIARLRLSIKTFEEMRANSESFPGKPVQATQ